ncbi:uncharacterized protein LOC128171088 [Crassostrea angulata]|uniref:uncharacterized protein LOC128171088 n=1 Tax=Magallana angulata TaxID=2784310 RepID=UPI00148AA14E|nr:uncharacterized protein LOC105322743 [Crassostrea gigas]XP_052692801.1 uncharacterized protein LOC128171088 [Crassostrea angulata]
MHSDGELDESKFVPDYNEELTPSQSSHGEPASTNTSSLCSMDLMILDEVRCSSDEVEDPKEPVNQLCADKTKEAVLDKPLPTRQEGAAYHCPLCQISLSGHVKRHVFRVHLPPFWGGNCNQCDSGASHTLSLVGQIGDQNFHNWCELVNGSLHLLGKWVGVDTLEQLLNFVVAHQLYPPVGHFTDTEIRLMSFYARHYSNHVPSQFQTSPPNHVICITHWQVLCTVLRQLSPEKHNLFRTSRQSCGGLNNFAVVVDSHFHLDQMFARGIISECSEVFSSPASLGQFQLLYAVANYVFPKHWSLWESQVSKNKQVRVTFGIHPHLSSRTSLDMLSELRRLVALPECIAVGEIGIDMTTTCDCQHPCSRPACRKALLHSQMDLLSELLVLAMETNKAVVLHCRDSGTGEAAKHVLQAIRMLDMEGHLFHRHCFTGSVSEAEEWMESLPSVLFGISPKIYTDRSVQNAARFIPLERMILETDSPYLAASPAETVDVAREVAKLKALSIEDVLRSTSMNAARLYEH